MSSVFFQISGNTFIEASKLHARNNDFAIRIISFANGVPEFVYLPDLSLDQLSLLALILRGRIIQNVDNYNDLYNRWYRTILIL
ncbi:hypothetical protein QLL95_gp1092 [Cotonvirus japonicus]|uniref:Uncharacterized protein n=1 Tax=Cotonvirus japonicus TaxID=2811091 RepID=A0ABM7NSB9_9VIRU|nr:hypothetical protein QLL95_gp1092 [Cotonvirus japonicus]BCS83031.1 hypothetical protein [Cotonvirus japonicus]